MPRFMQVLKRASQLFPPTQDQWFGVRLFAHPLSHDRRCCEHDLAASALAGANINIADASAAAKRTFVMTLSPADFLWGLEV